MNADSVCAAGGGGLRAESYSPTALPKRASRAQPNISRQAALGLNIGVKNWMPIWKRPLLVEIRGRSGPPPSGGVRQAG